LSLLCGKMNYTILSPKDVGYLLRKKGKKNAVETN